MSSWTHISLALRGWRFDLQFWAKQHVADQAVHITMKLLIEYRYKTVTLVFYALDFPLFSPFVSVLGEQGAVQELHRLLPDYNPPHAPYHN